MKIPTKRLEILERSLNRKKSQFDEKLAVHFEAVRAANGQPLNDKRNGSATIQLWDKQNNSLKNLDQSIKKTEEAIDRERSKIAHVDQYEVPNILRKLLADGTITQWRKHPRFFFVAGVEKARIVVQENGVLAARYVTDIPSSEQYAIFRSVFNALKQLERLESAA